MNETKKRNQLEKRRIIAEARKEKQFQIQSLRQQIALLRDNLKGERKRIVAEARQNRIDIRNRFAQRRVALREEERNLLRQINQLAKDKILTIRERREKISEIRQEIKRVRSINVEKEQKTIDLINASLHPLLHYMEAKTGKEPHHEKVIATAIAKPEIVLEAAQHPAHVQLKELEAEHKQHTKKTRATTPKHKPDDTIGSSPASTTPTEKHRMVGIRGNTYEHYKMLRRLGGVWNSLEKVWTIPASNLERVKEALGRDFYGVIGNERLIDIPRTYDTYPASIKLRKLGGVFNKTSKIWSIPQSNYDEAISLLEFKKSRAYEGSQKPSIPSHKRPFIPCGYPGCGRGYCDDCNRTPEPGQPIADYSLEDIQHTHEP